MSMRVAHPPRACSCPRSGPEVSALRRAAEPARRVSDPESGFILGAISREQRKLGPDVTEPCRSEDEMMRVVVVVDWRNEFVNEPSEWDPVRDYSFITTARRERGVRGGGLSCLTL